MRKERKTIYYKDERNDDFAGTSINSCEVDGSYRYIHKNPIWRAVAFFLYYAFALPLVWFFERVILRVRFVNKKAVKKCRTQHYFLYGNHTGWYDAFTPNLISAPTRCRIIVSPDTVSIKGLRTLVEMFGAIPTPTTVRAMRNFNSAIEHHRKSSNITVFPEAHIWPYYTGVRSFPDVSFTYPVRSGAPVIAFFTAYTPPKGFLACFRPANMTVYVSDPIYPNTALPPHEARAELRDKVYEFMSEKSRLSTYEVYNYVKQDAESEDAGKGAESAENQVKC